MSKEYIISVPDDAGFIKYSYIRGGRKYNTHYAYRNMECLVRCRECRHRNERCGMGEHRWCEILNMSTTPDDFCSYGEREGE